MLDRGAFTRVKVEPQIYVDCEQIVNHLAAPNPVTLISNGFSSGSLLLILSRAFLSPNAVGLNVTLKAVDSLGESVFFVGCVTTKSLDWVPMLETESPVSFNEPRFLMVKIFALPVEPLSTVPKLFFDPLSLRMSKDSAQSFREFRWSETPDVGGFPQSWNLPAGWRSTLPDRASYR